MKTKLLLFGIAFGFLMSTVGYSQQGKSDAAFNTYDSGLLGDGFDGVVRTVSLQSDGKLIVGGEFLNFNGAPTPYLCRLFPDGSKDTLFLLGSSFNANVYSSLIQSDGKIIIGGSFTLYNGSVIGKLVRLNSDGSQDLTFDTAVAANSGIIHAIAMQIDGSIVVVGSFAKYNGVAVNKIARILPNGTLDTSFATGTGANGLVDAIQIQSDGKILIAGSFTVFNGTACGRIIRLNSNGSFDSSFSNGSGFDDTVRTLALQTDGKILVGGDFLNYNAVSAHKIIRLNNDGSIDASFNIGTGFSDGGVYFIKLGNNGSIMVGGSFHSFYNGTDVNRLVYLDSNGSIVPTFDISTGPATATILTLASDASGNWYIGGSFLVFDSQNQGRLAKIDNNGTLDIGYLTAGVGFDNSVLKIISLSDNKTMIFGNFTKFNGAVANRIARLLEDGTIDLTFNSNGIGAGNSIRAAVIQPDNKILFAGSFLSYNGFLNNRIARVLADGSADQSFTIGTGFNNQVYALALQSDGKIIVGGNFTSYNGSVANRIVRLLANGAIDATFNTGLGADAIVETVLIQPDGKILLGGRFSNYNGFSKNKLVCLNTDGSVDLGFSVGSGFDKNVYSLAMLPDNKIIIGGSFLNYNGNAVKRIVRLNSNGGLDSSFQIGSGFSNGEIRSILVQPDNRLLIGGTFSGTFNGKPVKRLLRLLSDGGHDPSFIADLNSTLFSICFTPDAKVIIGGNFNSVSGLTKHRIARLKLCNNSSIWDGVSWSNGPPSVGKELHFNSDYNITATVNSCLCAIASGHKVTVKKGNTLALTFDFSGLGILHLENNASLYQSDDEIVNTGVMNLERETTAVVSTDYSYWSSPVFSQKLIDLSPNTLSEKFYSFDAATNDWFTELPSQVMKQGKGYIIRGPEDFSTIDPAIYKAQFLGIPNNGEFLISVGSNNTSNLLGNPYPSAIDADVFLAVNSEVLDGTIYLWTHNTPITNNEYTSSDYAVYNRLGGVATRAAINLGLNNTKPDGKIASGQAFFTTSISSGKNVIFNNSMRVIDQNASFFKSKGDKKSKINQLEKHRIWLNLSNKEGLFKQALIGYSSGATNEYDSSFDGESFNGNQYLDFYSISQDKNLVIQGRALPFDEDDLVFIGYRITIAGLFTISIDQIDGILLHKSVFLEDKLTNVIFDLKKANYNFETAIGTFNDRFILRYTDKTLDLNEVVKPDNRLIISFQNDFLKINSLDNLIDEITIYDISGKRIWHKDSINDAYFQITNSFIKQQILIVKVLLDNGTSSTRKVIVP
ncbi:T9SS sorting signal type C domain-containing protein [Flavobacterium sp. I-SCBP12n]|uniref:T9SS sorting signal type C domain-containing protein n=1 Tax=Flavobacterium pygoscelis TaxID=2893176 RepID=A0A9X1XNE6_9FLAO|nr:T9SS sorting signal type C domain-containing protein [Flavobacterium pygoscelis]MCK8140342.1 T9SS sorting signal type C domain-containing protein [Flavobacterium pygoscelis]